MKTENVQSSILCFEGRKSLVQVLKTVKMKERVTLVKNLSETGDLGKPHIWMQILSKSELSGFEDIKTAFTGAAIFNISFMLFSEI